MSVYRGRHFDPVPAGVLQGTRVVVDLMQSSSHLNEGYHVFCDSYVCSINLATQLLQNLTYITGTCINDILFLKTFIEILSTIKQLFSYKTGLIKTDLVTGENIYNRE